MIAMKDINNDINIPKGPELQNTHKKRKKMEGKITPDTNHFLVNSPPKIRNRAALETVS